MVECPICDSVFQSFEPFGAKKRTNAKCKACGSLERHRLLWMYINSRTKLLSSRSRLLHFAPEKSFFRVFSKSLSIDYYPCDLHPDKYNYSPDVEIKKIDIADIDYDDAFFDVILCSHVLQFVRYDASALIEVYRVLRKTGWVIFMVPIDYSQEKTRELDPDLPSSQHNSAALHPGELRRYGTDFKNKLVTAGFEVHEENFGSTFTQSDFQKFGFRAGEIIYLCKK